MTGFRSLVAVMLAGAAALAAARVAAQPAPYVQLFGSGTGEADYFGAQLDLEGEVLLVGSRGGTEPPSPQPSGGRVYEFRRTDAGEWVETDVMVPLQQPLPNSLYYFYTISSFGATLDLSPDGRRAVVGAPGTSYLTHGCLLCPPRQSRGAAFVFRADSLSGAWTQEAALVPAGLQDYNYAGEAVALSGSEANAFAVMNGPSAHLFVFRRVPGGPGQPAVWIEEAALTSDDPDWNFSAYSFRPYAARPSRTTSDGHERIAAGAPWEGSGRLYVFRNDGPPGGPAVWVREARLTPPAGGGGRFGGAVALSPDGRLLAAGSYEFCDAVRTGQTYVYRRTGEGEASAWALEATLAPTPGPGVGCFGGAVSLSADPATGQPLLGVGGARGSLGQAYVFRRSTAATDQPGTWSLVASLDGPETPDFYYRTPVLSGWTLAASNSTDNRQGNNAGTAWVFELAGLVAGEGAPVVAGLSVGVAPNPARTSARVTVAAAPGAAVRVAVYDALGRQVALAHEGALPGGRAEVALDVGAWPAGVYAVRAEGGGASATARLVVAR